MRKVRINRKKWLRGGYKSSLNPHGTYLWLAQGNAGCCLGHVCKQISRKTEKELEGELCPAYIFSRKSVLTTTLGADNDFAIAAMGINDNDSLSESQREHHLISLFLENNITLEFFN
jgi:hypothetical protein